MRLIASSAAVLGLVQLGWILSTVIQRGLLALGWDFFFHLPTPPMVPGGGVANAILGSLVITLLATIMAVPLGLLAGIGLAEFGGGRRFADWCRLAANILGGIPSIIVGVFVYGILVVTTGHFLRLGRRNGPGDHHAAGGGPDHRGYVAADPRCLAGIGFGFGVPVLAADPGHHFAGS